MNYDVGKDILKLKTVLRTVIASELKKFADATGIEVSSVDVHINEVTRHSDERKRYLLTGVDVRFDQ